MHNSHRDLEEEEEEKGEIWRGFGISGPWVSPVSAVGRGGFRRLGIGEREEREGEKRVGVAVSPDSLNPYYFEGDREGFFGGRWVAGVLLLLLLRRRGPSSRLAVRGSSVVMALFAHSHEASTSYRRSIWRGSLLRRSLLQHSGNEEACCDLWDFPPREREDRLGYCPLPLFFF